MPGDTVTGGRRGLGDCIAMALTVPKNRHMSVQLPPAAGAASVPPAERESVSQCVGREALAARRRPAAHGHALSHGRRGRSHRSKVRIELPSLPARPSRLARRAAVEYASSSWRRCTAQPARSAAARTVRWAASKMPGTGAPPSHACQMIGPSMAAPSLSPIRHADCYS